MNDNQTPVRDDFDNDDLLRFTDGALDDAGRIRVLTWLSSQPAAIARVESYLDQKERLRALRAHLPMADSVRFAWPRQQALVKQLLRQRGRRSWSRYGLVAAAVLALMAGVVGLASAPLSKAPPTATNVAAVKGSTQPYFPFETTAAVGQQSAERPPVAAAADQTLFEWLERQASDVFLTAPSLDELGLSLVAADTLETSQVPAIRMIYQDADSHPVVFYAGIARNDAEHAFWLPTEGFLSMQWRRGPVIFALIAPSDSAQLSALVELTGAAVARTPEAEQREMTNAAPGTDLQGPLQSIAVPLARPKQTKDTGGNTEEPIKVDPLHLESTVTNDPEPL